MIDTSKPARKNPLFPRRRAIVSTVATERYYPMALAMGYSLKATNDIAAQHAEMVLFVRKAANLSETALNRLRTIGWKLRIEDDIVIDGLSLNDTIEFRRYNLNKIRFWSWTEYDQILFIDADILVKGDLSEVWNVPGSKFPTLNEG